jgi:hypothetical protein
MPKVKVNGQVVNFPDSMSPEDITAAIEKDILPNLQKAAPAVKPERPSVMARMGRGALNTTDRIAQLWIDAGEKMGLKGYPEGLGDIATQQMNAEQASFDKAKRDSGFKGVDWAQMIGNAGIQAPLILIPGGTTALTRAGSGAVTGAISGGLQYDPTNTVAGGLMNIGKGAAVGAVAAPILGYAADKLPKGIKTVWEKVKSKLSGGANDAEIIQAVPELGNLTASVQKQVINEARKQMAATGELNAEALGRKANLLANDVTPTKSMVTRNPADWGAERNLQKLGQADDQALRDIGQELTGVYQSNDQALTNKLGSFTRTLPQGTQEAHGMTVMRTLDELSKKSQGEVSKIYQQVRDTVGDQLASDAKNLTSTLDDLRDNTYAEKLVSSVTNKLKRFGMLDKEGNLTSNTLTVTQAEELRKFVNTLPNDFGKSQIIKAIDSDVLSGMGTDAFSGARSAAQQRFAMLENPATQRALNTLGELSQGKTAQGFIKSQVVDAAEQDVASLVGTLGKAQSGQQAKDALKAGLYKYLESKAINQNSGQFSGAGLNRALTEIGENKLKLVLGDAATAQLKSLARAALDATYQPPYAAVNHSNTAPALLSLMNKMRYAQATPLIGTAMQQAGKIYQRNTASTALADALAAKSTPAIPVSPEIERLARALAATGSPAAVTILNQRSKSANGGQ